MSDSLPSNRLQFEEMPDELLLEIFQYVDPIDLRSFKGLNKRISGIIESVKVNILIQHDHAYDLDLISNFTSTQIIRLEVHKNCLSMNLYTMTELRSLTFGCIHLSKEQQHQVTSTVQRRIIVYI